MKLRVLKLVGNFRGRGFDTIISERTENIYDHMYLFIYLHKHIFIYSLVYVHLIIDVHVNMFIYLLRCIFYTPINSTDLVQLLIHSL